MDEEPDKPRRPSLLVTAAVLIENGRVLVTQRPAGKHLAGLWEFPGGKVEADEDPRAALARELYEEVGIRADVGDVIDVVFHRYETKNVVLIFFYARRRADSPPPVAVDVADCAWRRADELRDSDFPPADVTVLTRIRQLLLCSHDD